MVSCMDTPGLTIDGSGARPTITKTATDESARRRLAHEAEMLRRAEHPGVVTLLGHERDGEVEVLRTAYCGSRTLATTTSMSVARVAGTISALATTVADLHDMGLAHGRLTADHVVINADGRPVVCGFAEAVAGDAARSRRADDVAALGTLLHGLLAGHDDLAPLPVSRFGRRGAWTGYQRRALLNLADQAACDDPMLRPTARQLAQSIRATVPDATLVDAHAPADSPLAHLEADEPARRRTLPVPHLRMVGTAAALIAVALALARFAFATD